MVGATRAGLQSGEGKQEKMSRKNRRRKSIGVETRRIVKSRRTGSAEEKEQQEIRRQEEQEKQKERR